MDAMTWISGSSRVSWAG